MAARNQLLLDPLFRRSEISFRVEHLLAGRDVVRLAGQQIGRASDRLEIQAAAEANELALGEAVLLEELMDRLKIPAPRQVEWVLIPPREDFALGDKSRIVEVFVKVDVLLDVMLIGMHVLPSLEHELAPHQSPAELYQVLIERHRRVMSHALDRTVSGVGVDRRAGENERVHFLGKTRRRHRRHPSALAKPDQVDAASQVVDCDDKFGEVIVDVEILHVVGRRLPIGQDDMADAVGEQRLDQALAFGVVGDHRRVARAGRVDEGWNSARTPIIA